MNSTTDVKYTRYSIFSVSGKLFGLEISTVREVLPPPKVTYLPNVPTHVIGVFNLRGSIISLVDIQQILDLGSTEKKDTNMVLLVESSNLLISFIVEQVLDFVEVENSQVKLPSGVMTADMKNFVRGIFESDNMGQINLLDTERLLASSMVFVQEN